MITIQKILIGILVILTFLTRFVGLDGVPPHLGNDEISIAYDAYSISKTLKDTHNHFLPISFQSHNTYKAPLAIYLTIPFITIFGNNEYGARLPSALLGSLTILVLGLLIYELTCNRFLSFLTSFILAVSPWHIFTSRMLLESNIALFFLLSGIYLFYFGLNKMNKIAILLSYTSFALSIYGYHTEWIFTPIIITALIFFNRKSIVKTKIFYSGILLFLLLISPIIIDYFQNIGTNARANTELIFKDPYLSSQLKRGDLNIFQKSQYTLSVIFINYSSYINPRFIFFNGLELLPFNDPFQTGLFLSPFLPMLIIGLYKIRDFFKDNSKFIYIWIVTAPLIPALTFGGQSIIRDLVSVIPYSISIGVGCLVTLKYLKNKTLVLFIALSIFTISFFYFLVIYFYHFPFESGEGYQYGYKQIALYIKDHYNEYKTIIIDPRFGDYNLYSGVPTSYIPYFTYLDPNKLINAKDEKSGFYFDKYIIKNINWNEENPEKNNLYVVPVSNSPTSSLLKKILEINLPNTKPAFRLYTLN